jgi:peptidoglycan LD-endopeptidase CwlK
MYYDKRNRENLDKLADNTKAAALKWYDYLVKNGINVLIYETIRTEAQQREYVRKGASKTMRSYHRVGQALDFVPVNDKGETLWNGYTRPEIKQAIAEAKRLGFEWGGDWKSFKDMPHLQYNYKGYGTDTFGKAATVTPAPAPSSTTGDAQIRKFQAWLNDKYKAGLAVDGIFGPKTKKAALKAFQREVGTTADGIWGPKTRAATKTIKLNAKGDLVMIAQGMLYCRGYDPKGLDGIYGKNTASATKRFQKAHGLTQDGIIGKNTFEKLFA